MITQNPKSEEIKELDGSITRHFLMEPSQDLLRSFLEEIFNEHWKQIVVGPCIPGSVFEIRMSNKPKRITLSDGYLTVDTGPWHFHLCIGKTKGSKKNPTPPKLAKTRQVSKAAFFHISNLNHAGIGGSWGFRMWNGAGEQMLTIFFPNPWLTDDLKFRKQPDNSRLKLWESFKAQYTARD